jgi:hypothetical protein
MCSALLNAQDKQQRTHIVPFRFDTANKVRPKRRPRLKEISGFAVSDMYLAAFNYTLPKSNWEEVVIKVFLGGP